MVTTSSPSGMKLLIIQKPKHWCMISRDTLLGPPLSAHSHAQSCRNRWAVEWEDSLKKSAVNSCEPLQSGPECCRNRTELSLQLPTHTPQHPLECIHVKLSERVEQVLSCTCNIEMASAVFLLQRLVAQRFFHWLVTTAPPCLGESDARSTSL